MYLPDPGTGHQGQRRHLDIDCAVLAREFRFVLRSFVQILALRVGEVVMTRWKTRHIRTQNGELTIL
jgi:hypothetical protein